MFEAFQERDYRRFWTTQFVSNIGSWMQGVGQGWLVYHLTSSPFLLGFVGFANSIPTIFLMLPGGVLADQLDRRKVLRLSQWGQALAALALAVSIRYQTISVWQIIAAALVVGACIAFSAPAYQAMVVDLLDDRRRLPNAVAMNSLQFNLSRAIGPVVGGLALSRFGSFWCFFLNAASFLPLIWVLRRLPLRQLQATHSVSIMERLAEGIRYIRGERIIMLLLAVVAAASFFGFPFITLMPMVAKHFYRNDAEGLGYLLGASGIGALVASLSLSIRMPREQALLRLMVFTLCTFGLFLAGIGLAHSQAQVTGMLIFCGASMVTCVALANTALQQRIPDEMRGRVLSFYTYAFFAFLPCGNLMAGVIAEHRGLTATFLTLGGGLLLSTGAAAWVLWGRSSRTVA
jgi:MFS family permease